MARSRGILSAILAIVILAVGLNYTWQLKAKINKLKNNISVLNNEKQAVVNDLGRENKLYDTLNDEYQKVQNKLKIAEDKLVKIDTDFQNTQKTIEELNSRISILKVEGETLRKENENVKFDLNEVTQEKNTLQDKMSSVTELKKAIKELKKQRRQEMHEVVRWISPRSSPSKPMAKEIKDHAEEPKVKEVFEGNRGFMIKDKKLTYKAKVKIEVEPFNR